MSTRLVAVDVDPERGVMLRSDFTYLRRHIGLHRFPIFLSFHRSPCTIRSGLAARVRYDLARFSRTIRSGDVLVYDINLRATHTTIPSTRGVQIPIDLVSSTTDSIRRLVVLFKPVRIPTSDPKSEFLCQSSYIAQNLQAPLKHLVRLGYLPRPRHHVSPVRSKSGCSH